MCYTVLVFYHNNLGPCGVQSYIPENLSEWADRYENGKITSQAKKAKIKMLSSGCVHIMHLDSKRDAQAFLSKYPFISSKHGNRCYAIVFVVHQTPTKPQWSFAHV